MLVAPLVFRTLCPIFHEQLWDMRSGSCAHQLQGLHTDQVGQKRFPSYPVACIYTLPVEVLETEKCMRYHIQRLLSPMYLRAYAPVANRTVQRLVWLRGRG